MWRQPITNKEDRHEPERGKDGLWWLRIGDEAFEVRSASPIEVIHRREPGHVREPRLESERAETAREVIRSNLAITASAARDAMIESGGHKYLPPVYPPSVRAVRVVKQPDEWMPDERFDVLMVEDPEVWVKIKPHPWKDDVEWWFCHDGIELRQPEVYHEFSAHDKIMCSVMRGLVGHCINVAEQDGSIT